MARLSPDERRTSLLAAGRRLWSAQPFDAVRPDDITRATGTSIGLVYHHFASKRGFYVATVRDVADELLAVTEPGAATPDALVAVVRAYVDYVGREGRLLRAVLRGGLGVDPEVARIADGVRDVLRARVCSVLALREDARVRALLVGWIGACEAIALDQVERGELCAEAQVELMVTTLWRMLG